MKNHDTLLAKDGNLGSIQMRKEGGMLGHNRDANPGYKEKLHNMRGGENVTSGFTSGLRQNSFKDSVNSKLGLHSDQHYAEPHHGVPQRLKNGGMADDSSMLNRGRNSSDKDDCHGGAVPKRSGGSCNERAPGRPQMAGQFEKSPRHGDMGQTQFAKRGHHADAGQRQFEKKPARAKTGGQMEAEHHGFGDIVGGLAHVLSLGMFNEGGQVSHHAEGDQVQHKDFGGFLKGLGDKLGSVRQMGMQMLPMFLDEGGDVKKRGGRCHDMGGKIDKKAIGGVAKIRHGQMKHRDRA